MSLDVYLTATKPTIVYSGNVTHNLGAMAKEAGLYWVLWRPDECGITKAGQLIEPLKAGLSVLLRNREDMQKLNPRNGWGDYDGFVDFVSRYLDACKENPEATVDASR